MKQSPDAAGERGNDLQEVPGNAGALPARLTPEPRTDRDGRSAAKVALATVLLTTALACVLFILHFRASSPQPQNPVAAASAADLKTPPSPAPRPVRPAPSQSPRTAAAAGPQGPPVQPEPRTARQLVAEIAALSQLSGPLTPEQAARFKQDMEELIRGGAASVPAIQELLAKNQDFRYAELSGGEQLGYSSLRAGLIDALRQIPGPEAHAALLQTFQATAVPGELLELSKNLDQQAPGQYREQFLIAAQETLKIAAANQLGTNVELGPAFRMLQNYGDLAQGGIADSARNDPQNFLSALTLAGLPDGQGLQGLVQMVDNSSPAASGKAIATEMIAQLAGQSSDAFEALVQLARNGRIANGVWVQLAPILGGDTYQLGGPQGRNPADSIQGSSEQGYQVVDSATTPEDIGHRMSMIEQFLGLVPADSAAANALRHEQAVLRSKLAK